MPDMYDVNPDGPALDATATESQARALALWHALLQRMAGALSDDLISEARGWLAEGQQTDVAQALVFAALSGRIPVTLADADLISSELIADGQDIAAFADLEIIDEEDVRPSLWAFAPVPIEQTSDVARMPILLDLTIDPAALAELDQIDRAAIDAVGAESEVLGLWRAWRVPADGSPWPSPRRVYIVSLPQTARADEPALLTARMQNALEAAGEEFPQVEACQEGLPVPAYQGSACAHAALLWAAEPAMPIQLARVFDAVDPLAGPSFDPEHPRIEDLAEVVRLLDYLDGAVPVLASSATMVDILDPEHPSVVPLTFRTDGQWIWTDTVSYYLEEHLIAPEEGLLAHLRAADALPAVSDVALHRVMSFLQRPDDTEAVWVVPETAGPESQPAST